MICDNCKRQIERKFYNAKTVNCLAYFCERYPTYCQPADIVEYCFEKAKEKWENEGEHS